MKMPAYAKELRRLSDGDDPHAVDDFVRDNLDRILRDAATAEAAREYAKAMHGDWVPARYNRRNELLGLIAKETP